MPRFVQFDEFGSRDYLHVVERERPWPGPGQLLVRVMAAGLNPMDYKAYRDEAVVSDRTVDSHVKGIRRRFAEASDGGEGFDPIETVYGVGYRARQE